MCLPFGELLDLVAIDQIKVDGYTQKHKETEEDFWHLLEWK